MSAPRAGERAGERALAGVVVVDLHRESVAWRAQREIEGHVHVGERRDVEVLGRAQGEGVALPRSPARARRVSSP